MSAFDEDYDPFADLDMAAKDEDAFEIEEAPEDLNPADSPTKAGADVDLGGQLEKENVGV